MSYRYILPGIVCTSFLLLTIWKPEREKGDAEKALSTPLPATPSSRRVISESRVSRRERLDEHRREADGILLGSENLRHDDEAQLELLRVLVAWSSEDLDGVAQWVEANDKQLPANRRWLGDVLVRLARSEPRRAFEFGLRLNEENQRSYDVPPRQLLGIALKKLTVADAIRAMEAPERGSPYPYRIESTAYSGDPYREDFDFEALGEYLVWKAREEKKGGGRPPAYPEDLVASWTRRDPEGAEKFCRAINDYPFRHVSGAVSGEEFTPFFVQLGKDQTQDAVVEKAVSIVTDPSIKFRDPKLAKHWIADSKTHFLLGKVAERLPERTRDLMAHTALDSQTRPNVEIAPEFIEEALRLFATPGYRETVVSIRTRLSPKFAPILGELMEKVTGAER